MTGQADICFLGIEPARAGEVAFTAPYVLIEGVYAVPDRGPPLVLGQRGPEGHPLGEHLGGIAAGRLVRRGAGVTPGVQVINADPAMPAIVSLTPPAPPTPPTPRASGTPAASGPARSTAASSPSPSATTSATAAGSMRSYTLAGGRVALLVSGDSAALVTAVPDSGKGDLVERALTGTREAARIRTRPGGIT